MKADEGLLGLGTDAGVEDRGILRGRMGCTPSVHNVTMCACMKSHNESIRTHICIVPKNIVNYPRCHERSLYYR